jgi:hypothetical protein
MFNSVQPLNNTKRAGDWRESQTRPSAVFALRKNEKHIPIYARPGAQDLSSFSDLLQKALKKTGAPEDDLAALMNIMSGGNDRIRTIARSLTAPIPQTEALLDATVARARVTPYGRL